MARLYGEVPPVDRAVAIIAAVASISVAFVPARRGSAPLVSLGPAARRARDAPFVAEPAEYV